MNMKKSMWLAAMAILLFSGSGADAQHPMMDRIADQVIAKYQQAPCEQLWEQRAHKTPPTQEQQNAIQLLRSDQQLRVAFINRIAAPIANKMFDCGLIP